MADRYWVGGTGSWDASDTTHWSASSGGASGASVPTSSDNVFFNSASNGASYTCTITASANCNDLSLAHPSVGSFTFAGSSDLSIYGSLTSANISRSYTGTITFRATSTGKTITSNGELYSSPFVFDGVGGGWTLQDNLSIGSTRTLTLTNGSLDINGKTLTASALSSSNSNVRTLTLGAATLNLGSSATPWTLATSTNLTFSGASATINLTGSGPDFRGGGQTYGTVTFTGASQKRIFEANTFGTLTITGTATKTNSVELWANQTVSGTFTASGNSSINRLWVLSGTTGTARTITAATVTTSNSDWEDITGAGAASWDLSAITGLSGDCGGNSGITFTSPVTNYWVGGTGNWDAVAEWASSSGGAASSGRVPLPQDTARFDANSFSAGSLTVTNNVERIGSMDWTGATNTPTYSSTAQTNIYGSVTFIAGMTLSIGNTYSFKGRGSHTITMAGGSFLGDIDFDCSGGTYTISDDFGLAQQLDFSSGTFTANNFNVTAGQIYGGTTAILNMGSGTWECTGYSSLGSVFDVFGATTINSGTSTVKFTSSGSGDCFFEGGGNTYHNFWVTGARTGHIEIWDENTFNDITVDTPPQEIQFISGYTQTVTSLNISGTAGNLMTITSDDSFVWDDIAKASGVVSCDYLNLVDSHVGGGATFYAGANSTNGGNNTGWHFNAPDKSSQFLQFA